MTLAQVKHLELRGSATALRSVTTRLAKHLEHAPLDSGSVVSVST